MLVVLIIGTTIALAMGSASGPIGEAFTIELETLGLLAVATSLF